MIYLFFRGVAAALGVFVLSTAFVGGLAAVAVNLEAALRKRGWNEGEARAITMMFTFGMLIALIGGAVSVAIGTIK